MTETRLTAKEIKAKYLEMRSQSDEAYKTAEPERLALQEAERPYHDIEDQIEAFLDEHDRVIIDTCENCSEPIFEGEKCTGGEFNQCEECAPSWQDLLDSPENFQDPDGNLLTLEKVQPHFDAHISAGGKPEDKMVS